MKKRINCWEYTKCGREAGGDNCVEFGVCPASISKQLDGINGGKSAGRACWLIQDTLCNETVALKFIKCSECGFRKLVEEQEGEAFQLLPPSFGPEAQ